MDEEENLMASRDKAVYSQQESCWHVCSHL